MEPNPYEAPKEVTRRRGVRSKFWRLPETVLEWIVLIVIVLVVVLLLLPEFGIHWAE